MLPHSSILAIVVVAVVNLLVALEILPWKDCPAT